MANEKNTRDRLVDSRSMSLDASDIQPCFHETVHPNLQANDEKIQEEPVHLGQYPAQGDYSDAQSQDKWLNLSKTLSAN